MPDQATNLSMLGAACLAASLLVLTASAPPPAAAQQAGSAFREGTCSGVLCDYIGGAQAPAARPQKSVFPEGECGGVLCDAIGGSQAPKRSDPPPPCGGGLLCDLMPYRIGVPLGGVEIAQRQEAERQQAAPLPIAAVPALKTAHRKSKPAKIASGRSAY